MSQAIILMQTSDGHLDYISLTLSNQQTNQRGKCQKTNKQKTDCINSTWKCNWAEHYSHKILSKKALSTTCSILCCATGDHININHLNNK